MKIQDFSQDIECIMKVKSKDEIITYLIERLSLEVNDNLKYRAIEQGWIEALKWVLSIDEDDDST